MLVKWLLRRSPKPVPLIVSIENTKFTELYQMSATTSLWQLFYPSKQIFTEKFRWPCYSERWITLENRYYYGARYAGVKVL